MRRQPAPARARSGKHASSALVGLALLLFFVVARPLAAQETYRLTGEEGDKESWVKQEAVDPDSPEGELLAVRKVLAGGDGEKTVEMAEAWQEKYGADHPLYVEAKLLAGLGREQSGELYEALFDYEYVLRLYPASEQFNTAIEREYEIGKQFLDGWQRPVLGIPLLPVTKDGREIMIRIHERASGTAIGERAVLDLADHYFKENEMQDAAIVYDRFLLNYPESPQRQRAMLGLIKASLARFRGPEFDSKGLIEAAERLRAYQDEFPAAAERLGAATLLDRIDESLAIKTFYTGRWFERRGQRRSAIYQYRRVVQDYPDTAAALSAIDRLKQLGEPVMAPRREPPTTGDRPADDQPPSKEGDGSQETIDDQSPTDQSDGRAEPSAPADKTPDGAPAPTK